jgi:hypothetical protein
METLIRSITLGPPYDFFATNQSDSSIATSNAGGMRLKSHSQVTLEASFVVTAVSKSFVIHPRETHLRIDANARLIGSALWIGLGICSARMEIKLWVEGPGIDLRNSREARRQVGQWVGGFYPLLHFFQAPFRVDTREGDPSLNLFVSHGTEVRDRVFFVAFQLEARTAAAGWTEAIVEAAATPTFQIDVFGP